MSKPHALVRYDAARRALAEAHRIDEVKDIRDKAVAMRVYAMQAKDRVLIDQATEIRMRAERRAGELLAEMAERKARETKGGWRRLNSRTSRPRPKFLAFSSCEPPPTDYRSLFRRGGGLRRWRRSLRLGRFFLGLGRRGCQRRWLRRGWRCLAE
jgi:hypothetical protein